MLNGARGVISVTANVVPKAMAELCAAALRGDRAPVERLDAPLRALHEALFLEANPIPVKWALARAGPDRARHPSAVDASCPKRCGRACAPPST